MKKVLKKKDKEKSKKILYLKRDSIFFTKMNTIDSLLIPFFFSSKMKDFIKNQAQHIPVKR
jgi:hypothetical protein